MLASLTCKTDKLKSYIRVVGLHVHDNQCELTRSVEGSIKLDIRNVYDEENWKYPSMLVARIWTVNVYELLLERCWNVCLIVRDDVSVAQSHWYLNSERILVYTHLADKLYTKRQVQSYMKRAIFSVYLNMICGFIKYFH